MKLKGLGRTIKVNPRRIQAIKTWFGCRIVVKLYSSGGVKWL